MARRGTLPVWSRFMGPNISWRDWMMVPLVSLELDILSFILDVLWSVDFLSCAVFIQVGGCYIHSIHSIGVFPLCEVEEQPLFGFMDFNDMLDFNLRRTCMFLLVWYSYSIFYSVDMVSILVLNSQTGRNVNPRLLETPAQWWLWFPCLQQPSPIYI